MSIQDLIQLINTQLPDNNQQLITEAVLRGVLGDMVDTLSSPLRLFNIESTDVTDNGDGTYALSGVENELEGALAFDEGMKVYQFDGTDWTLKFAGLGDFIDTATDNGDDTYTFTSFDGNTSFTIAIPVLSIGAGPGMEVDVTDPKRPAVGLDQASRGSLALADNAIQPGDNVSKLNNDAFVDLTTNQTIAGEKTFEGHMFRNNRLSTLYNETRVETRPVVDRIAYRTQPTQPLSALSDYHGLDMSLETYNSNSDGKMSLYTAEFQAIHRENDDVRFLVPGYFRATNNGTGNVLETRCIRITSVNNSTGTIGTTTGVYINSVLNPSGTVNNQYGIKIASFSEAGDRNVGIEIGEMSGGALKNFGIESNASLNYFKGLRVGSNTSIITSKLEIPADANPILIRGFGERVIIQEGGGPIDKSDPMWSSSVMIGGNKSIGSSLFVATESLNDAFSSGLGVDGEYDSETNISQINVYGLGVRSGTQTYSSQISIKVTRGQTIKEAVLITDSGVVLTIISNASGDFLTIDPATNKITKRTATETREDLQVNKLDGYTVANLPPSPTEGDTAYVTDADAPSYLTPVTGGGSVKCPVFFNGTDWVCH